MYKITKQKFGVEFSFTGAVSLEEMKQWRKEMLAVLPGLPKGFGVLVDNRELRSGGIAPDAMEVLIETQTQYKKAGMARSCNVLSTAMVTMQCERLAKQSGIYAFERYINAAAHPDWRAKALAWIENSVDPGK